jgi:alpha-N-arabinofuranosidase
LNKPAIERAGNENIDMIDEHAYRDADWIRTNYDYFDKYERTPWSVYVGEYASHHSNGDLYAGLGDAVYLMMMERNGDLVKMASYAPLFVNVNEPSWKINLIEFDAGRSFAHTSYYIQKTFNENRPDVNVGLSTTVEPKPDTTIAGMAGKFGLGTFNTHSEFKDLKIFDKDGELLYSDDFSDLNHWDSPGKGTWKTKNNVLMQEDTLQGPTLLTLKDLDFKTGKITLKARKVEGKEGFVLFFNISGKDRFIFCNYGAGGNDFSAIHAWGNPEGYAFKGGKSTKGPIDTKRWYDLELLVDNNSAEMYLDGKKISDARIDTMESFFVAAGYNKDKKSLIIKAVNYNAEPVRTLIDISGASWIGKKAKHIIISSEGIYDQNTLDNPEKIIPREEVLKIDPKNVVLSIPPYSVSLIEIPIRKKHK